MSDLDPSLPIRKASIAALEGDVPLKALMAGDVRVHDAVPDEPVFPYITFDHAQVLPDDGDCDLGAEVFMTWSVWSRALGSVEAAKIANRAAFLLNAELPLDDGRIVTHDVSIQHQKDPDGLTSHSVIVGRYETASGS